MNNNGITFFFTGLSGSGKTTLSKILKERLEEKYSKPVTLFDGDIVRAHLSKDLGFSKKDRIENVKRVGFVAREITKHGGLVICALMAPFVESRREVRKMVETYGRFVEIYVSTPLEVCEKRDSKGMYAKARAGEFKNFTGIDSPYEKPKRPDIIIDTSSVSIDGSVEYLLFEINKYILNNN